MKNKKVSVLPRTVYKNWPEICKLTDHHLIALLSFVECDSELGQRLRVAFPECFSANPLHVPIPWSVLVEDSTNAAGHNRFGSSEKLLLETQTLHKFDLPYIKLIVKNDAWEEVVRHPNHGNFVLASNEERKTLELVGFGGTVTFRGHTYIVAERFTLGHDDDETMCLVPAHLIAREK